MELQTQTDEQRLAEFSQKLNGMKPEGFDDKAFATFTEAVINFHKSEIQGLKINSAKMKEEKETLAEKYKTLESNYGTQSTELKELQEKLAANQPDELRKHFENQQAQLSERFTKVENDYKATIEQQNKVIKELEQGVLERDVMAEFNKAAGKYEWVEGGREAAQAFVLGKGACNFKRLKMSDNSTLLVNDEQQDVSQALEKFTSTGLGKNCLSAGISGGGAEGSNTTPNGGKRISQAEYDAMSPSEQMDFSIEGGQII